MASKRAKRESHKQRVGKRQKMQKPSPPRPGMEPSPVEWTEWQQAELHEEMIEKLRKLGARQADEVWINNIYQVLVYRNIIKGETWPQMHWLSIKRLDKGWIHDWREFQRIKNDIIGAEYEAVELYPAESRKVDTSNQYHLFVLADTRQRFPFGYNNRLVSKGGTSEVGDTGKESVQRDFAPGTEPDDAMTGEETNELYAERMKQAPEESPASAEKNNT